MCSYRLEYDSQPTWTERRDRLFDESGFCGTGPRPPVGTVLAVDAGTRHYRLVIDDVEIGVGVIVRADEEVAFDGAPSVEPELAIEPDVRGKRHAWELLRLLEEEAFSIWPDIAGYVGVVRESNKNRATIEQRLVEAGYTRDVAEFVKRRVSP